MRQQVGDVCSTLSLLVPIEELRDRAPIPIDTVIWPEKSAQVFTLHTKRFAGDGRESQAAVGEDLRRNPLHHLRQVVRPGEEGDVRVRVDVDESRRKSETGRIDGFVRLRVRRYHPDIRDMA